MTRSISFAVHGLPAAQGSKRHVGGGVMVESSKAVKPWRQDVVAAALEAIQEWHYTNGLDWMPFDGPVQVEARFYFPRPKSHFGTGSKAAVTKDTAPTYVAKKPDIDKVLRSTFDALGTAGIWRDDSQAVVVNTSKAFALWPSAFLRIEERLA